MLASYFKDLAAQEEATAKFYDQMAEIYQEKPLPSGYKAATPSEMRRHCRYFAENARKAAKTANRMAEEHQKLAEWMRNAPSTIHRSR